MATQAGVGISHHRDPKTAGGEAAEQALRAAGIEKPDFVLAFAAVGYDQSALVSSIRQATGRAPLAGCSGEGVIGLREADESPFSVGVMALRSDEIVFRHGLARSAGDWRQAGACVGQALRPLAADTRALLVFADGLSFNFDRFTAGLASEVALDGKLPLLGGTAADNMEQKCTYQYCDDEVVGDGVSWALLSGPVRVATAVRHGCIPIGVERKVTRAEGNVIHEIDGKPALDVLKEYLPEDEVDAWRQRSIGNTCLGFEAPAHMKDYGEYVIRYMAGKGPAPGSIVIPTEVTAGTSVWITRRDHDLIADSVKRVANGIKATLGGSRPKLVLQFDCAGRGRFVLREQQKMRLLKQLQDEVGADVPWLGFYTYGEIGPVGDHNCFHNYTAVVAAVY
jgi:hypothetical protein